MISPAHGGGYPDMFISSECEEWRIKNFPKIQLIPIGRTSSILNEGEFVRYVLSAFDLDICQFGFCNQKFYDGVSCCFCNL